MEKWGWRGRNCNADVDECELRPADDRTGLALALGLTTDNAGCGQGDETQAVCDNTLGARLTLCYQEQTPEIRKRLFGLTKKQS